MWSRVGQTQSSCLCRACLHAPKTIARRSTTAATRRRKVTATDLFTACYTTILGTAAIIDAQNKERRKQDLDTKLEKARAAVNNLSAQNAALLSEDVSPSTSQYSYSWLKSLGSSQFDKTDLYQQCLAIYGEQWRQLGPRVLLHDSIDWIAIEKAIAAEHHDPRVKLIEPGSDYGLFRATKAVITLVDELVAKVEIQGDGGRHQSDQTATVISTDGEKQLWQDMREARDNVRLPAFGPPNHDPTGSAQTRSSLRESFIMAIDGATTHREMVARICYNLLVSNVPPSITLYNTLIAGFHRIQRPDLAQSVVNSILRNTVGPDTEQTTLCLLGHFRSTENAGGIRTVAQRMRGGNRSTRFLNTVQELPRDSGALKERRDDLFGKPPQVFVKVSPVSKSRYDALIRSWLSVGNTDRATKKFIECLRHNVHTENRLIARLLENCALGVDGVIARKLVKGIAKHTKTFLRMIQRLVSRVPAAVALGVVDNLYRVLELSFDTSVTEYGRGLDWVQDFTITFKPWVSAWRIQLQTRLAISETREMLQYFSLDQSLPDRILDAALNLHSPIRSSSSDLALWGRGAKISNLQSEFDRLYTKGVKLRAQIRALIIKHKTGLDFDPQGDLESPSWTEQHRQFAIADALEQVTLRDSMSVEEVREELVAKCPDSRQAEALTIAGVGRYMGTSNLTRFYGPGQRRLAAWKSENAMGAGELEAEIVAQIQVTKAMLYGALWGHTHRVLWRQYPDWDEIPTEVLVDKHIRRCVKLSSCTNLPRAAEESLCGDKEQSLAGKAPAAYEEITERGRLAATA